MVVEVMTKSIKPESLKTAVQKQLQLQRNKALKSDVFRDKPQAPSREGGRDDDAKNNVRVDGMADAIVPKIAEPPARKGCLKCGDMSHRDAGEAETPLVAQRGVLLENIVHVDDVLLDYGSDVTVVTRGIMDALDVTGVSVPHLAYPYGSDTKPVVTTRSVKFNCVTLDTRCGLLVLRGLKAWVDDATTATHLIVSHPAMELLVFSVEDLLVGARKNETFRPCRRMNCQAPDGGEVESAEA
ncbi:hypothetical protein DYB28_000806 [Aphanomyces astaci]|uniref:Peptidase A2 domain-containing protein n=1 Tax=Aphanomyces astaci TaxID=112090 RepID=A0A9X8DTH0_APHAT|nr:hypothetical protein DYB28_000806 [Aphanomyces astaci]